jgi:hypothetical protein
MSSTQLIRMNSTPLIGIGLIVLAYLADYLLTLRAASLYGSGADQVIAFEGSYELNPRFTADIDKLRPVSPRFLVMLLIYSALLWAVWNLSVAILGIPQVYDFFVGAILLVQGPVQVRHIRNLVAFTHARAQRGMSGRIVYSRAFSYKASAVEFLAYAGLFLVLAALTSSWLMVGGTAGCAGLALNHYRLSRTESNLGTPG